MSDTIPPPAPDYAEAIKRLREENLETGKRLDDCVSQLNHFARVMRGEAEDLTGVGAWRIFVDMLEQTMSVKVLPRDYCDVLLAAESRLAVVLSACDGIIGQASTGPEARKVAEMVRKLAGGA